jgi:glycosyltransferase involved in cell wall biosynthesis
MTVHSAKPAGAQLVALGQAQALSADCELTIAVGHGELRPRFAPLGALVRAPTRVPIWGATRPRWALEIGRAAPDAVRFAALIRRERIDAVVANSTVLISSVLGARLAGVPIVVHAQEAPKSRAARRLFRFHGALADCVVAISPGISDAFGAARAHILLNPVGIPVAGPPQRPARAPGAAPHLVVVGTVDRHKRQDLAVEALRVLHDGGLPATLDLIGLEADAEYVAQLRERTAELGLDAFVTFAGQCSDVDRRLLAADALLLPAGEVTPLVLMEAMAQGTPVVAARMGSVADVVGEHEQTGMLFAPDDVEALAAAVRAIAEDPELAERLSRQGRERIEERYDERRSHARLRAEIGRLVGR